MIPLAAGLLGGVTLPHLIAVSALSGMCATTFDIAERSYFAGLVHSSALRAVLARTLGIRGAAEFLGFGSAGLLIGALGGPAAIGIDALTYLASAVLIGFLRVAEPTLPPTATRRRFRRELVDGLKATWGVGIMRPLLRSEEHTSELQSH